jgi:RHS repeat-associated protein
MGYADGDGVRQQFTLYERDNETGLDFAKSRYFSSVQGRFTSVDPAMGSAKSSLPQSWNRYSYTVNSPLRYIDPTGMIWGSKRIGNVTEYVWFDGDKVGNGYDVVTEFYVEGIINGRSVSLTLNPDGPRSALKQFLIDSSDLVVSALFYNDDYHVKGYAIGETREQFRERSRRGAIDPMPNQGFEVGLFFAGGPVGRLNRGTAAGILTPYGRAFQATTPEALAAREAIESGATLYRGGVLGQSAGPEGQFWALENPLLPGYAQRYGIPAANQNFNFIEYGRIKPGAPFITRPTPGGAPNAIEAVVDPNSVKLKGFNSQ